MNNFWFEEDLIPLEEYTEEIIKGLARAYNLDEREAVLQLRSLVHGILRVDRPRWGKIDEGMNLLRSDKDSAFFLVRLGFQFDLPEGIRDKGIHYVFARCEAFLWSVDENQPQPQVYDVIPKNLYEGEPRKVTIRVGPEIKISEIGGSIGEASTDLHIGYITPSIVGWPGEDERTPYWELRPVTKELTGSQHLWLLVEFPHQPNGFRLATRVEAKLQSFFGPIPVGPKNRIWSNRPSVVINASVDHR